MYRINEFITPEERLDGIRVGALRKLASYGMKPSDLGQAMEKSGANPVGTASDALMAVLKTAVVIGVPVGALMYAMRSSVKKQDDKTRKMQSALDHYNDQVFEFKNSRGIA
jgi:multisubunit Na+/H+ antiporter MnhC subunit